MADMDVERFFDSLGESPCIWNDEAVSSIYEGITKKLIDRKLTITTMESCTSGMIASFLTDTEGASAVLKGAYVTYSNEAKVQNGVPSGIINNYGVYSEETAVEMACACMDRYDADFSIGITGTFGNTDPSNEDSIERIVYVCIAREIPWKTKPGYWVKFDKYRFELCMAETRHKYKLLVAIAVAKALEKVLDEVLNDALDET